MCDLKDSQNFFLQALPLHIPSFLLNDDIVDIKKSNAICFVTFVDDEFSGRSLHFSIVSIKHSWSSKIMNGALSDFWCRLNFNISMSSDGISTL